MLIYKIYVDSAPPLLVVLLPWCKKNRASPIDGLTILSPATSLVELIYHTTAPIITNSSY